MQRGYHFLTVLAIIFVSGCVHQEAVPAKRTGSSGASNTGEETELLEAQLKKSTNAVEKAQLEEGLGRLYSYRTGLVDYPKAVVHLTAALQNELSEHTYLELLMLRGNCEEVLGKNGGALRDYLRGLLGCSYHDLSGGWPEYRSPHYRNSVAPPDPEWHERMSESRVDRNAIDTQRSILLQRYGFVDCVQRLLSSHLVDEETIRAVLAELSTDNSRCGIILHWLNSENKQPNP